MISGWFRGQAATVSRANNDATSKPECAKSICMYDAPFCQINCMWQRSRNKERRKMIKEGPTHGPLSVAALAPDLG